MFQIKLKLQNFLAKNKTKRKVERISTQVRDHSLIKGILSALIKGIILFFFGIIIIFPFYFMLVLALSPDAQANESINPVLWPESFEWVNFSRAFEEGYVNALGWSILIAAISIVAKTFFSMTFGYTFSLKNWKFKRTSWVFYLSILVLPEVALLIGQYRTVIIMGIDTGFSQVIALVLPFVAAVMSGYMFRNAFEAIPDRIKEAAMVDGCSRVKFFFKVAIPMVTPTIWTVGILTAFASWNSLLWPLLILGSDSKVQIINIWLNKVGINPDPDAHVTLFKNVKMAGAILAILPMFIAYFLFRKRILTAISRQGSTIKG